ncbi:SMC-Scp complex subunit ScpB [Thermaerobacter litoralis]
MSADPIRGAVEALLFVAGEPLTPKRMAAILGVGEAVVRQALEELAEACRAPGRGIELVEVAGGWQLVTRPEYSRAVEELLQPRRQALSRAALETLAIIAYRQPVTRAEIEAIRGVQSDAGLRALLERGLVREVGRKEGPGRPILYGTTPLFLQQFGLRDLSELPPPGTFVAGGGEGGGPEGGGAEDGGAADGDPGGGERGGAAGGAPGGDGPAGGADPGEGDAPREGDALRDGEGPPVGNPPAATTQPPAARPAPAASPSPAGRPPAAASPAPAGHPARAASPPGAGEAAAGSSPPEGASPPPGATAFTGPAPRARGWPVISPETALP